MNKANHVLFYSLIILFTQCLMASFSMVVRNLTTDQLALVEFKQRIVDPRNVLANNWTVSSSVCDWVGVSCSVKHGRVTSLNLPNMNLNGSIPPQLGNLSFLSNLNLSTNNFYGPLPEELSQLHRLRLIDVSFNSLTGEIPPSLGNLHKVEKLAMRNNDFEGLIPRTLGNMSNLETLSLAYNQLSGSIPSSIFNLSSLKEIYLYNNTLSSTLPDDLCLHLPKLELLYLHLNQLSGSIPSSIGRCSNLRDLALSYNHFDGLIPANIGNLSALQVLHLGLNNLKGEIPKEIGNLHSLESLNLGDLGLVGQIPASIFNVSSLNTVYLANNSLSGSLPDDLCRHLPKLQWFAVHDNQLSGNLPSSIGDCYNLQNLTLSDNQFSGLIPTSIVNLTMLLALDIAQNNLEGNIPPMTKAPGLERLVLWGNNLSGNIPNFISNASMLKVLSLGYNSFSGLVPTTLGNLRNLEWLQINGNHLTTDAATDHEWTFLSSLANCRNLRYLAVSQNPLKGILPAYIGNLSTSIQSFYAGDSELKGNLPSEIGNLSSMLLLEISGNEISGRIPESIGRLPDLQSLNLANNKFEGSIPSIICGLERLYMLSLSSNVLHGPILTCLGNLTSLRYLYLDSNNLSSEIPSALWRIQDVLEIDLSSNYLSFPHPLDVGNLRALLRLNLSRNMLRTDISSTLGGLESLVSLDLSFNILHGNIPESFGGLVSLEFLDLCNNNLSGVIPKSLEKLASLKFLNVSFNRLEGEIPSGGPFRNFSSKSFMKNYALCGPTRLLVPPCRSGVHKHSRALRVLTYCLPIIASIILVVFLIFVCKKRQRRNTKLAAQEDSLALKTWRRISHAELVQATDGFADYNFLGSGSFGTVYKGRLLDGTDVAVKVFNLQIEGAFKSFDVECEAMHDLIHRNLVKVITCCSNVDFKALVFDFMPNGSLEKWLHSEDCSLDMVQRMDIMIDVASALEYLHIGHPTPVVHCDLKPSNILLDEDMVAHLGDFGIAKLLGEGDSMIQTMTLATIGYMAPEFGSAGIVSTKCDIYSFGILLIETFTKMKPTNEIFTEAMTMRHWVKSSLSKGMIDIADANLLKREDEFFIVKANCISSILELALDCAAELPEERKHMEDVVASLKKIKHKFLNNIEQLQFGKN